MTNVISLDFDFWMEMPESENYDWSMREVPFFLDHIWMIRAMDAFARGVDLREQCNLPKDEPSPVEFSQLLIDHKLKVRKDTVAISESHMVAYKWFSRLKDLHIIHIDAHHDFGYVEGMRELNCDNWVKYLVDKGKVKKITLIYPKWRLRQTNEWEGGGKESAEKLGVDVDVCYGLKESLPHNLKIRKMFICRSGAWVPPWMDKYFMNIIHNLMSRHENIMMYGWAGLEKVMRWKDPDVQWKEIKAQAAAIKKMMKKNAKLAS
jgi:hypothetical protein